MKKRLLIALIVIFLLAGITFGISYFIVNKDVVRTQGIELEYRVYNSSGWSKWYKNGQIAGEKGNEIKGIQIKAKSDKKGHVFYNTYSESLSFDDNDEYDGETSGDLKKGITGIKITLSDQLYKSYILYYRTRNEKNDWLGWSNSFDVPNGNKDTAMDQVQIKVLRKINQMELESKETSIGL